ncbi:MAG: lamin tail domain-containing protein [Prevotellaceae bacterium]|nr:lamin tail domain-containing protein [Prevotellaceae bacterium]
MRLFYLFVFLSVFAVSVLCAPIAVFFGENYSLTDWSGDDSCFVISDDKLYLDAPPGGGVRALSLPSSSVDDAEWSFLLQLDSNPSGSNYTRFYLTSDSPSLRDSLNGYFLQIGNASDQILLYRQTGLSVKKIAAGETKRLDLDTVRLSVRVTRSALGSWHVFSKMNGESEFVEECSAVDSTWKSSFFCGFYCKYTSTRRNSFSFDSLYVDGSSFVDSLPPVIKNVLYSDTLIKVYFSEKVDVESFSCEWESRQVSVSWNAGFSEMTFSFPEPLVKGQKYELALAGMSDLFGNSMRDTTFYFGLPEICGTGNVILNEVMFHPNEDGVDYVELYNVSDRVIDLSSLYLATYRNDTVVYSAKKLGKGFLFPHEYLLLTTDKEKVCSFYECHGEDRFLVMDKLPAYGNEKGCVVLMNKDSLIVDDFCYSSSMHDELLPSETGVSLERCSPDSDMWHSASESAGFGTPGYINSMMLTDLDEIVLETEVCYPYLDEEGNMRIRYSFMEGGYVTNVSVFNLNGVRVCKLLENCSLSTQGTIVWNGKNDTGAVLPVAPYIILFEAQNTAGATIQKKFVCLISW